ANAAAVWGPTARSSIQVCPPPGWRPIRAKRESNRADSPAMRTSQHKARLNPAPTAGPFTAATVGRVQSRTDKKPSRKRTERLGATPGAVRLGHVATQRARLRAVFIRR